MNYTVVFTLLATLFSNVSAISSTDAFNPGIYGYASCIHTCYISPGDFDNVQDCVTSRCEGVKPDNNGENNADASQALISETETAPDIGHDLAYYLCVDACYNGNFEETFADVENCISSRCEEDKAENDGENNADASQVLISETETAPGIGYDLAYYLCVDACYNQNFEVEKCIRSRCERDEAENDASLVLISETETAPGSHLSPCQQNCFRVGGSFNEVQDCLSRCRRGNTKNGDVKNTIVPEVDISENDSTAQTPFECVWDCLLALKVQAVSVDDINQCKDQCEFSVTVGDYDGESNLRGSNKSDKAKLVPHQIVSNY